MKNKMIKVITKRGKRLGRGYGSGKGGHTVGKGQKGQKTRKRLGILFEGVKVKKSLIKRLPFLRGKSRFDGKNKPIAVDLKLLNKFPAGSTVDYKYLVEHNVVTADDVKKYGVKILGNSEITKKMTINLPISKSASEKIVKAGGKVLSLS